MEGRAGHTQPQEKKLLEELGSYKPIRLLANLGKVVDKMVAQRLTWWLQKEDAMDQTQAGFRKGRLSGDQCLNVSDKIEADFSANHPSRF